MLQILIESLKAERADPMLVRLQSGSFLNPAMLPFSSSTSTPGATNNQIFNNLKLDTTPSDGLESLNVVFDTGEKKAEWEETFSKAKEKLEAS